MPGRTLCLALAAALLATGCGGGAKTDADQVAQVLRSAAGAVADGDGQKACSQLTAQAQAQAAQQVAGGVLGSVDCVTMVKRATAFMAPLDRQQIKDLQPSNVVVNGNAASATLSTSTGSSQTGGISVQVSLAKAASDWKISGFSNEQGLPGG